MKKYTIFIFEGEKLPVNFIEAIDVADGVICDTYEFVGDTSKDLGIVRLDTGVSSPHQLVVGGDETLLGYISGNGKFIHETEKGVFEYKMREGIRFEFFIHKGEKMKWVADSDSQLIYYEVYLPPYKDGRYLDL